MNLSAENISKIRNLVRSGYPLKASDAQDLLAHNDHLIELLEARFRLMLSIETERDQLKDKVDAMKKDSDRFQFIASDAESSLERIYGDDWLAVVDVLIGFDRESTNEKAT